MGCELSGGAIELLAKNLSLAGPSNLSKKLQKSREIVDFTAFSGGDEGDRTLDLTDANRTRSQLRYGPTLIFDRR